MTQLELARKGRISSILEKVSLDEKIGMEELQKKVARGEVVIPANRLHKALRPLGIGGGLRVKVNANLGTSADYDKLQGEMEKLAAALQAGADTVMDLSTGGNLDKIRREIMRRANVPVGTVPIYQAGVEVIEKKGSLVAMTAEDIFQAVNKHGEDGVDFITVHCGLSRAALERLKNQGRLCDIVSRGGAFLAGWMIYHDLENPLLEQFDRLLEIAYKYDITLSLGDGLRPGCLSDATDRAQIQELISMGELVDRSREAGVQVMVEGPGHIPLHQVEANVQIAKSLCSEAPLYVLGPLVTDIAPGYDHIVAAIGGALAARAGADFLCYVTPAEHLGLPTVSHVQEGVIAARIAAHAADLARGREAAWQWDHNMSKARKELDWKKQIFLAIDSDRAREYRRTRNPEQKSECTMCGKYCAMKIVENYFSDSKKLS